MRLEKSVVIGPGLLLIDNACSSMEDGRSGKLRLGLDELELELLGFQIKAPPRLSPTVVALSFPSILFVTKFKMGVALGRGKLLLLVQIKRLLLEETLNSR